MTTKRVTKKQLPFTPEVRARWRKVKAAILAEPRLYNQADFGDLKGTKPRVCGSACCLAGWYAVYLPRTDDCKHDPDGAIRRDCPDPCWTDADESKTQDDYITDANGGSWPEPFRGQFLALPASHRASRAKIAAKRIDHLLRTGK